MRLKFSVIIIVSSFQQRSSEFSGLIDGFLQC
jgi:hypothetical protein